MSGEKAPAWVWLLVGACGLGLTASGWILVYRLPQLARDAAAIRTERAALDARKNSAQPTLSTPPSDTGAPDASVAGVKLQAGPSAAPAIVTISPTTRLVVWLEDVVPESTGGLDIQGADGKLVVQIGNLRSNTQGGVVFSLPAAKLRAGAYQLRLFSVSRGGGPTTSTYHLEVRIN